MGVFRAITGAVRSAAKEQWKEAFFCDALPAELLMVRGHKRVSARSANDRADDEIITNGSLIAVADGQAVVAVSQGRVVDVCTEPGEHGFFDPDHPGGVGGFLRDVWSRFGFGGADVQPIRHRLYYINTKECGGNRFETPSPVAVRVHDPNMDMDLDLSLSLSGVYAYRVEDPAALYRAIGNVAERYECSTLSPQLDAEIVSALSVAVGTLFRSGARPYELPKHVQALSDAAIGSVGASFMKRFGLKLLSLSFDSLTVHEVWMLKNAQRAAILRDPEMAAATQVQAVADALKTAADR